MNSIQQAFIQDIIAHPDDNGWRLVYADWLEENEQPERANFIRVQCRLSDLNKELLSTEDCAHPTCPGCAERRSLLDQQEQLRQQYEATWWACEITLMLSFPTDASLVRIWERGFIAELHITVDALFNGILQALRLHPIERLVYQSITPSGIQLLASEPKLIQQSSLKEITLNLLAYQSPSRYREVRQILAACFPHIKIRYSGETEESLSSPSATPELQTVPPPLPSFFNSMEIIVSPFLQDGTWLINPANPSQLIASRQVYQELQLRRAAATRRDL